VEYESAGKLSWSEKTLPYAANRTCLASNKNRRLARPQIIIMMEWLCRNVPAESGNVYEPNNLMSFNP
jgi:hypothetical protein